MHAELVIKEGEAAYDADDFPRAARLLLPMAERGHAQAQYLVAEMYRRGNGVAQDAAASVRFYRAAADQGHPRAAMGLSIVYCDGDEGVRDEAKAKYWANKYMELRRQ